MMRQNNFDIIRLLLATAVVLFHASLLSHAPVLAPIRMFVSGPVAVEGFFAISGFLIFASYERASSLRDYYNKRAARILPGYWLATAVCLAIAFGYGSFHVGKFLLANLSFATFLSPSVPGVFESNPDTPIMNGALWTIKVEVMFYVAVPIIVWLCRRLHRDAVLVGLFVASVVFHFALRNHPSFDVQLPGQLCYFLVGTLIFYHLDRFKKYGMWIMVGAVLLYVLHVETGWFFPRPLAVASLTLGASLLLPVVKGPTRWGDFSYGTYVLHWPLIQLVLALGVYRFNPFAGLAVTLLLVFTCAALSWFLVEKPALDRAHSRRMRARIPVVVAS